jgi:hypothetical protein
VAHGADDGGRRGAAAAAASPSAAGGAAGGAPLSEGFVALLPALLLPIKKACEALPSMTGSCAQGAAPQGPSASPPGADVRHLADAGCTMSPLSAGPLHVHAPCGAAQAPTVTTPGAAASSDHRQEPLAMARAPCAPTVKARSVDCRGSRGSQGPR